MQLNGEYKMNFPPDPPKMKEIFDLIRAVYWQSYYEGAEKAIREARKEFEYDPKNDNASDAKAFWHNITLKNRNGINVNKE